MNYSEMSNDELLKLYNEKIKESEIYDVSQQAKKILLNSLYGATASPANTTFNVNVAESTTACGQMLIRSTEKMVSEYINEITEGKDKDKHFAISGDTDSERGTSTLHLLKTPKYIKEDGLNDCDNEYVQTVEDFYNSVPENYMKKDDENKSYVKRVDGVSTLTVNKKTHELEYTPIVYVMKHTVKKKMYTLKVGGKDVTVTADHSLVCERNNELIKIKPAELQKGDFILYLD